MKNIIIIDVDTERQPIIQISKTNSKELPKNKDEAKDVIIKDMACITEALCSLIHAADQSNFKTLEESKQDVITHIERSINDTLINSNLKVKSITTDTTNEE